MFARPRLEKLIEALLEIDRRRARQVIEIVALAIPRQRRSHRRAITRMKKVVGPGKVLLFGERGRRVAKVRRVIVETVAAILPCRAARESDGQRGHRWPGRG